MHIQNFHNLRPAKLINFLRNLNHHLNQHLLIRILKLRRLLIHMQQFKNVQKRIKHARIKRFQNRRISSSEQIPKYLHLRHLILQQIRIRAQR
jgi:hypothetical protein